jgi:HEAT repeat protein
MDAIIGVFIKLEASSPKGQLIYLDFKNAMVEIASPGWKPQLLERLNRPMEMVSQADKGTNEDKIRAYQNEQFWQTTAAELLGIIKASDAVKPLFKAVLDPNKADIAATAIMAMVKIGKDSMNVLIDSLLGKDAEINEFAKTVVKDKKEVEVTVVRSAALVIGTIGRADGVTPLLTALGKADSKDYITRAILARELAKLPASPESLKAFIDVMQNTPASAVIPPGAPAVSTLEESIASYYDSSVIDVLIKLGNDIKGEADDKQVVRDAALATIIKLMRKDQVPAVEKLISDWAPKENDSKLEKEAFKKAKGLLDACGDKVECYLAKIEEAAVQEKDQQFVGIKATYMLGILGNDSTRMEITKRLRNIKNSAIKYAAVQAIDHLAPSGDKAVADEMKRIMDANIAKGDANLILGDNPVKQVMFRLLARQ